MHKLHPEFLPQKINSGVIIDDEDEVSKFGAGHVHDHRQKMFQNFWNHVQSRMTPPEFLEMLNHVTDDSKRVGIFKQFFEWSPAPPDLYEKYEKNSQASQDFYKKAVSACHGGFLKTAELNCHKAFLFAATKEDFAHAHVATSILLHELKFFTEAFKELDLALLTHNFESPTKELVDLVQCHRQRFEQSVTANHLNYLNNNSSDPADFQKNCREERSRRKGFCEKLFNLKSPHPNAPAFEDFVQIKCDANRGRYVVTTKDVPIGTTVLVEKPFVAILHDTLTQKSSRCHHCFVEKFQMVPCPNCVFALYCNQNCLQSDIPSHTYECPCLPDLASLLNDQSSFGTSYFYQAFKTICVLGPEKLLDIFRNPNYTKFSRPTLIQHEPNPTILGTNPSTGIYGPSSSAYLPIFHLSWGVKDQEPLAPLVALMLTEVLKMRTNLFDKNCSPQFQEFVTTLILHHYESYQVNVYSLKHVEKNFDHLRLEDSMQKINEESGSQKLDLDYTIFGRGAFGSASLFNHSCNPNLMRFTAPKFGLTAFVTLRSLKEGEELCSTYGPSFATQTKIKRQNELLRNYGFNCKCIACVQDWQFSKLQHCCGDCVAKNLPHEQRTLDTMVRVRVVLNKSNGFKCLSCQRQFHRKKDLLNLYLTKLNSVNKCRQLVSSNQPLEALVGVVEGMEYFENNFVPPSRDLWCAETIFSDAVRLIVHCCCDHNG